MDESEQIVDSYVAHLRYLNRRPDSIAKQRWTLRYLSRWAAPTPLLELDFETIQAFTARPTLGPEARNGAITHARGFYRWAVARGLVADDPTSRLERPRRPQRLPRPMPDDAAGLALRRAVDPIRQWLYLGAYAGLRACEVAQLSGSDFVLRQASPVLIVQESKGGQTQFVPIAAPLREIASELAACRGWCFPKGEGDPAARVWSGHVSANQVQRRTNRFLHGLGIPQTFHQLRHWYGTKLHGVTGDLRITQQGMRHRSIDSTVLYTFTDPGDVAEALDALPRLTA